jgi:hypothetical protein
VQTSDRGYVIGARSVTYQAPAANGLAIPTVAPLAPTITGITAGDGSVTVTFTRNADNGGDTATGDRVNVYDATTNALLASANGTSPITVMGLTNGALVYAQAATIGAVNGVGPLSAASGTVSPVALVYSTFYVEPMTAKTGIFDSTRVAMTNSRRALVTIDNPATNLQTMQCAVVAQANNVRNAPTTGFVAIPPGQRATINGTDATKQIYVGVAATSTKPVTAANFSGTTATVTVQGHGLTSGAVRSFENITPTNFNMKNVAMTVVDQDTLTYTMLTAPTGAGTAFGYMFDASECVVVTTAEAP